MFRHILSRLFFKRSRSLRPSRRQLRAEFLESRALLAAQVFSDQADYAPGSTAYLTATGFAPGEAVSFNISSETPGPGQGSWTVTDGITDGSPADLDGAVNGVIETSWLVDPEGAYAGATLLVTATGLTSGDSAAATFTDAAPTTSMVKVLPTPSSFGPTVTANVKETGNGSVNIAAAEFFIDGIGANGTGTAMNASDNNGFNSKNEDVTKAISAGQFAGLSEGLHTVYVHGKDVSGNWGPTDSATFIKDTIGPAVSAPDLAAADDTGSSNTDNLTNKITPVTITINAEVGSTVELFDGATSLGTKPANGGTATFNKAFSAGTHNLTATATDGAANTSGPNGVLVLKIDNAAPTITASPNVGPNVNGWNNTDVLVNYVVNEVGFGIDAAASDYASDLLTASGTATGTVVDLAGNSTSASYSALIDKVAPTISAVASVGPNANGWNNTDVTVSYNVGDDNSGIDASASNYANDLLTASGTASGTVVDLAGNSASASYSALIDKVAPTISAAVISGTLGANGWYTSNVVVHYTCTDDLSGVVSCPSDVTLSTEGSAVSAPTPSVVDKADNQSNPSNLISVKIDKTNPTTGLAPPDGTYPIGTTFSWASADTVSGVSTTDVKIDMTQVSSAHSGFLPMPLGAHTVTVTTTDYAGRSTSNTRSYVTGSAIVGGNLIIAATNGNDCITTSASGTTVVVSGYVGAGTYLNITGHIIAYLYAGDDCLTANGNISLEAHGGDGIDTITGGAGHDVIFGDAGNDTITGAAGNDVLIGGAGNDRLVGSAGDDILIAGDVIDLLLTNYDDWRTLSNKWSASVGGAVGAAAASSDLATDDDQTPNGVSDDISDNGTDQLTGSAGHDWLIVSKSDKVTDAANDQKKDSDYIEII
jgi:hypothetical protein